MSAGRPASGRLVTLARLVGAGAVVYALLLGGITVIAYEAFLTEFDHAITTQYTWLFAQGQWPFSTIVVRPLLGDHATLGLALLAPLGLTPLTAPGLLVVQAAALASVAPLLFHLARAAGASDRAAAIPALLWLVTPAVVAANLFEFHPETLAAPLLVVCAVAILRGRTALLVVAAVVACSLKEDIGLTVAALGLASWWATRRPAGLVLAVAASAWSLVAMLVVLPRSGSAYREHFGPRFAGDRGDSVGDVLAFVVRNPIAALVDLVTPANVALLVLLVAGTGGLCLLAPRWLVAAAPSIGANLLSAHPAQHTLDYHYWLMPAAAVAIAGAMGARSLAPGDRRVRWAVGSSAVACCLVSAAAVVEHLAEVVEDWPRRADRARILDQVPGSAVVAVPRHLAPHVADRERVYVLAEPFAPGEPGSAWDDAERRRALAGTELVVLDPGRAGPVGPATDEEVERLVREAGFLPVARSGRTVLLRRDARPVSG